MVLWYWAEAVRNDRKTAFKSTQCASFKNYLRRDCDLSFPVAYIGLYTPVNVTGDYYVRTNRIAPFSMS